MGAWGLLGRMAPGLVPQGVILLYHRVAEPSRDPQLLCVSPENFAAHMELVSSRCRPCSLAALAGRALVLPLSVAVTFDDGYADNLLNARPILERCRVPATVFASTSFVADGQLPYWDELAALLLAAPVLPDRLEVDFFGERSSWEFGDEPPVQPDWNVLQEATMVRQKAYLVLCDRLRLSRPDRRREAMARIRDWAGTTLVETARFMSGSELRMLAEDGLVEVGAHTISHANLALLSEAEQQQEIAGGKRRLEEVCGRQITSFAYPYGTRENYTPGTVDIVRRAGFCRACSNFAGAIRPGTDQYQLPRMLVRNWSADEFAARLSGFFR